MVKQQSKKMKKKKKSLKGNPRGRSVDLKRNGKQTNSILSSAKKRKQEENDILFSN